jgi:hypothetical protein
VVHFPSFEKIGQTYFSNPGLQGMRLVTQHNQFYFNSIGQMHYMQDTNVSYVGHPIPVDATNTHTYHPLDVTDTGHPLDVTNTSHPLDVTNTGHPQWMTSISPPADNVIQSGTTILASLERINQTTIWH